MGDAFDVFDAPSATSPTNSPFRLFDAAAQSSAPAKRPRPATSILPVVRQFAEKHGGQTSADLLSIGQAELAKTLDTALSCLRDDPFEVSGCRAAANRVESLTWDALQVAGSWAHVSWREAYVMAQMLLCCADADGGAEEEALRRCDRAFILGGVSQVLRDIVQLLEPTGDDADDTESANAADGLAGPRAGSEIGGLGGPSVETPPSRLIPRRAMPTTAVELRDLYRGPPVVLTGGMAGWRAPGLWADLGWLRRRFGERLVPVELGSLRAATTLNATPASLTSASACAADAAGVAEAEAEAPNAAGAGASRWGERLMLLREFVDRHLLSDAHGVGYVAQHSLFEQLYAAPIPPGRPPVRTTRTLVWRSSGAHRVPLICARIHSTLPPPARAERQLARCCRPSLQQHFSVPPLCGQGKLQHVNGWLGPGGTVTPLHFDSYDNLFAQVVGHKYIRLYDAEQSGRLYARKGGAGAGLGLGAQGNLSAVDVESPDLDAHPLFAAAEWSEVVLGPGEMLFVPSRCWHYVRSLSTSFSISFWF